MKEEQAVRTPVCTPAEKEWKNYSGMQYRRKRKINVKNLLLVTGFLFCTCITLTITLRTVYRAGLPQKAVSFEVKVIHQDKSEKDFQLSSREAFLGAALEEKGMIEGTKGPYGLYVTKVDGEAADFDRDKSYWRLQINGKDALQGADQTPLEEGSQYTWIYTPASR